ncbi:hypothetical protein [Nitrosopumilus piranensis]|uniref:Uncharacterized protein n=1 Tax=Nitrosopumilus piranensis TaxID=1582439 RepID=A0A0C5BTH5_9ARCH|nr:hypothetical protein [Nitrosopumilus piranensis]AJM91479.1 hypothetical protein NPIRD3C_0261 [Nitrosopumilus piranensis]
MADENSFLIEIIISIAVSIGGGTFLGYVLSERSRAKQEKEDIKKIRNLIKTDFTRIYKDTVTCTAGCNKLDAYADVAIENLLSRKYTTTDLFLPAHIELKFAFWDTIFTSGSLIHFPEKELEELQTTVNFLKNIDSRLQTEEKIHMKEAYKLLKQYENLKNDENLKKNQNLEKKEFEKFIQSYAVGRSNTCDSLRKWFKLMKHKTIQPKFPEIEDYWSYRQKNTETKSA